MQHAVDPEAHVARVAAGLEVDVARALIEGVLQSQSTMVTTMLVVGVDVAAVAELDELLEVRYSTLITSVTARRSILSGSMWKNGMCSRAPR
jgi:hypothetical protein